MGQQQRTGHARLSASESHRWMACPGSVALCESVPRYPSAAATYGTSAHHVAALQLRALGIPEIGAEFRFMDDGVEKTGTYDQEMHDGVQEYVDFVRSQHVFLGGALHVEDQVKVNDDVWGTSDAVVEGGYGLLVADLKFGRVAVHVSDGKGSPNTQLMVYLWGAVRKYGAHKFYRIAIVQPRCWEVETVQVLDVTHEELRAWVKHEFEPAYRRVAGGDQELVPGTQCRFCAAQAVCPKMAEKVLEATRADFAAVARPALPDVAALTDEQMLNVLKWSPILDEWIRAVQERAFQELMSGKRLKGFKLVRKKSNRRWRDGVDPKDIAKAAGVGLQDIMTLPELKSPNQVDKVGGKKAAKAIEQYWEKPEGGLTMTGEDDPKPAVEPPKGDFGAFADDLI